MTPPDSEPNLPCPHGRPTWRMCPHCLALNAPVPDMVITEDVQVSTVVIGKPLAQRILAALESDVIYAASLRHEHTAKDRKALADELRALLVTK